jgi:hypothetical protein
MTIDRNNPTLLELYGMPLAKWSTRGMSQTLEVIDQYANIVRAIDGSLLDLSYAPLKKYKTTISGNDQDPPALGNIWPGAPITVYCVAELSVPEYANPERPEVPGSRRFSGGLIFYRPVLTMKLTNFSTQRDEYGHLTSWSLDLEED